MDRNSPISGKQTDMLSVGSLERLRVLSAEPNSLLEKPVGLLQEKMQPSVCVGISKVHIFAFSAFVLSGEYRASNKYQSISLLGPADGFSDESPKLFCLLWEILPN